METSNLTNNNHVSILSLNIANLVSKLQSLKNFISHLEAKGNRPDVIVLVETHIQENELRYKKEMGPYYENGYLYNSQKHSR